MAITMIPVHNSAILVAYGHDPEREIMVVHFHKTGLYQYNNVSLEQFTTIQQAESPGKGVMAFIKGKGFIRIDEKTFNR